jgi:hypothetical protein
VPLGLSALTIPALASRAGAQDGGPAVQASIARFASVTPDASCLLVVERSGSPWRAAHQPNARMFVGSAIKLSAVDLSGATADVTVPLSVNYPSGITGTVDTATVTYTISRNPNVA